MKCYKMKSGIHVPVCKKTLNVNVGELHKEWEYLAGARSLSLKQLDDSHSQEQQGHIVHTHTFYHVSWPGSESVEYKSTGFNNSPFIVTDVKC